jgi:hypothetical protein
MEIPEKIAEFSIICPQSRLLPYAGMKKVKYLCRQSDLIYAIGCVRISIAHLNKIKNQPISKSHSDIEWILGDSELEALILEMNLIKKYRPHYNIRLKDDKRYPFIKVSWADDFPKVTVTRQMLQMGHV